MYSHRFAVEHSNKFFEVSSICLDTFSVSCDQRTCKLTKHCSVVDASCRAENSLVYFFSRVHLVWTSTVNKCYKSYCMGVRINPTAQFQPATHVRRFKVLNALDMVGYIPSVCNVRQTFRVKVSTSGLNSRANSESEM
jgi:hypothetical protein